MTCRPFSRTSPGSPTRVRSRRIQSRSVSSHSGITSACAEQTGSVPAAAWPNWDHLRVCGADHHRRLVPWRCRGSPPRVRSRPLGSGSASTATGITSACAEQTARSVLPPSRSPDHLRVCGADSSARLMDVIGRGSPPRVRSRLRPFLHSGRALGITSACAEQTL